MRAPAVAIFLFLTAGAALGQHHQPLHFDYYRHWKQPGTNSPCCNARIEKDGEETGDCEPVQAEIRNGDWWAWLRQEGRWIEIPDERIVRERNPSGQQSHLCWRPIGGVICFVPEDTGG